MRLPKHHGSVCYVVRAYSVNKHEPESPLWHTPQARLGHKRSRGCRGSCSTDFGHPSYKLIAGALCSLAFHSPGDRPVRMIIISYSALAAV